MADIIETRVSTLEDMMMRLAYAQMNQTISK